MIPTCIHTETSDAETAELLTDMMSSPVLHVPSLAEIPESATAIAYVFANGPKGMGPLGFQVDVFDNPPGSAGYSPLRRLHIVTWTDPAQAVELTSAAAVLEAEKNGLVTVEPKPIVVNMPFLAWRARASVLSGEFEGSRSVRCCRAIQSRAAEDTVR